MPLFRAEAARHQDSLHGDVSLVPPLSWQLFGVLAAGVLLVAALFLALAGYARTTEVTGTIESDRGVIRVTAQRSGAIERLLAREGEHVAAGQPLAQIDLATHAADAVLEERRLAALAGEKAALDRRLPALGEEAEARVVALNAAIAADQSALSTIAIQRREQTRLIALAEEDLARARQLEGRGFISRTDIARREETLVRRQQERSQLDQQLADRAAHIAATRADIDHERAALRATSAEVDQARGVIAGAAAQDAMLRTLVVTAPVAGTVIGLTLHPGDPVQAPGAILSIIPVGARPFVRFSVTPSAAGFVAVGESARIAIDAFPRAIYGTVPARITAITPAAVANGNGPAAFLVDARLPGTSVSAYGIRHALRPGMTLTARIATRRQNLLEWLLDPLFAVRGR